MLTSSVSIGYISFIIYSKSLRNLPDFILNGEYLKSMKKSAYGSFTDVSLYSPLSVILYNWQKCCPPGERLHTSVSFVTPFGNVNVTRFGNASLSANFPSYITRTSVDSYSGIIDTFILPILRLAPFPE